MLISDMLFFIFSFLLSENAAKTIIELKSNGVLEQTGDVTAGRGIFRGNNKRLTILIALKKNRTGETKKINK